MRKAVVILALISCAALVWFLRRETTAPRAPGVVTVEDGILSVIDAR